MSGKYIMIGTSVISKDVFRNVLRPCDNYGKKPNGGFWASNHICDIYSISEWYTYLLDARGIAYKKNINEGAIFDLKEDAKILTIDNDETIHELLKKYPSYYHILNYYNKLENNCIDFELLSHDYDGVYLDYNKIQCSHLGDRIFRAWCVNTLLLFNLDCIEKYSSVKIKADLESYYCIPAIFETSDQKKVMDNSAFYIDLSNNIEAKFLELISTYNLQNVKDYNEYFEMIIMCAKTCLDIIWQTNSQNISEIKDILKRQGKELIDEVIVRNAVLNYLSKYLYKETGKIKKLSPSNHSETKHYII